MTPRLKLFLWCVAFWVVWCLIALTSEILMEV